MIKIYFLCCVMFLGASEIYAQKRSEISLLLEFAKPLQQNDQNFDFGSGVSFRFRLYPTDRFFVQVNPGMLTFRGKNTNTLFDNKMQNTFIKAGGGYVLSQFLYTEFSIGPAFLNRGMGTGLILSPNLGTRFQIKNKIGADIAFKYENWLGRTMMRFLGLSVGVAI